MRNPVYKGYFVTRRSVTVFEVSRDFPHEFPPHAVNYSQRYIVSRQNCLSTANLGLQDHFPTSRLHHIVSCSRCLARSLCWPSWPPRPLCRRHRRKVKSPCPFRRQCSSRTRYRPPSSRTRAKTTSSLPSTSARTPSRRSPRKPPPPPSRRLSVSRCIKL